MQDALARFEEADEIAPGQRHGPQHDRSLLSQARSATTRPLLSFNTALELVAIFTDARNNRGATYLTLGQFRLAEVDFMAVLGDTTYPHRWEVYYNLGLTYLQREQLGAAEENLRKAIMAPQPVFDAFIKLSEIAEDQGKLRRGDPTPRRRPVEVSGADRSRSPARALS